MDRDLICWDNIHTCPCPTCVQPPRVCNRWLPLQANLLKTMLQIENAFFDLAEESNRNCLVICDRGAMDASAFISKDQWEHILAKNSLDEVEIRDNRYHQVSLMPIRPTHFFGQLEQSSLGTFGPEVGQFSLIALQWPTSELWKGSNICLDGAQNWYAVSLEFVPDFQKKIFG